MKKKLYCYILLIITAFSCDDCKEVICYNDIPAAYFNFKLLNADTGEDLIFGENSINHPDSIKILYRYPKFVQADKHQEILSVFVTEDTLFFWPDRKREVNQFESLDTLNFEFKRLGMGKCCEEFEIVKANFNGSTFLPDEKKVFRLLKK